MYFPEPLVKASLIRRYKRFLADVVLEDGSELTVHTANTGSMHGCAVPGTTIWISNSHNPKRKYPFSWEIASTEQGSRVGINTALANRLVKEALEQGRISELTQIKTIETEVPYGNEKSRIDLLLTRDNEQKCFVEVKNVTASYEAGVAAFPDAVTQRGTKHLRELEQMVQQGHRGILFFCVQRDDIDTVRPAHEIDPVYAQTLQKVIAGGVEVLAYGVEFIGDAIPEGIIIKNKLAINTET
jgi:sugar fermentation stimulation protein A